jgi:hypothetical protein
MPRAKTHRPLNPAQERTAHLLGFAGLWGKDRVTPTTEITIKVDGCRFALDDAGRATLVDGDPKAAQLALNLLKHEGLAA